MFVPFGAYAILASGNGTNAIALYHEGKKHGFAPEFMLVNKENSPLRTFCQVNDIPCYYVKDQQKGVDPLFEEEVIKICRQHSIQWVFLAGFLKILSIDFLKAFEQVNLDSSKIDSLYRVVNIHPSLLPKYPGLGSYKKAYANQDETYGHTIHLVNEDVDKGPILRQKTIERDSSDSFAAFTEKGKTLENESYARILKDFIQKDFYFKKGKPVFENKE